MFKLKQSKAKQSTVKVKVCVSLGPVVIVVAGMFFKPNHKIFGRDISTSLFAALQRFIALDTRFSSSSSSCCGVCCGLTNNNNNNNNNNNKIKQQPQKEQKCQ